MHVGIFVKGIRRAGNQTAALLIRPPEYRLRALIPLPPKIRVLEPICMMQIPEFGVSGAEMYGTKAPNIDLPVPKFRTSGATDGSAEELADLKALYTPQIGTFWRKCLIQISENCHPNFGLFGMRPLCGVLPWVTYNMSRSHDSHMLVDSYLVPDNLALASLPLLFP